jgi:hypothetical protein
MAVCKSQSATIHIDHVAVNVSLEVCIDSPANGEQIPGTGPITVTGHGLATRVGPSIVIEFNGQASSSAAPIIWGPVVPQGQPRSFTWSWSGTMPASGSNVTITAQGTADTGADTGTHEVQELTAAPSVNVVAFFTPPNLEITSPLPSSPGGNVQIVAQNKNGTTVNVSGTASPATGSPFGLRTLAWNAAWIPGPPASGTVSSSDGLAHWNAAIQVPLGIYSVTFTCTDSGGNAQSRALNLEVALPADIFATEPEDYLRALLSLLLNRR